MEITSLKITLIHKIAIFNQLQTNNPIYLEEHKFIQYLRKNTEELHSESSNIKQ